jgi:hypothetical protein
MIPVWMHATLQQRRPAITRAGHEDRKMIRYLRDSQVNFDVPAPLAVCGVLLAATLTKGGHSEWAIAGLICLYMLYLVMQCSKRVTDAGGQPLGADPSAGDCLLIGGTGASPGRLAVPIRRHQIAAID